MQLEQSQTQPWRGDNTVAFWCVMAFECTIPTLWTLMLKLNVCQWECYINCKILHTSKQHIFKTVKSRANVSWDETGMTGASAVCASAHPRRLPQGNVSFRSRRHAAGSETALQTGSLNLPFPNLSLQPTITPFLRPAVSSHTHICVPSALSVITEKKHSPPAAALMQRKSN